MTPVSTSSGSRSLSPKTPDGRSAGSRANDFFEPAIAGDYDSVRQQDNRRREAYRSGLTERDEYEPDPLYTSSSPKKRKPDVLRRMNTITPGPFDVKARENRSRNEFPRRDNKGLDETLTGTTPSNRPGASLARNKYVNGDRNMPTRVNGYGGLDSPNPIDFEPELFTANNRSGTFPRPNNPEPPMRTPSAPGPRPDRYRLPDDGRPPYLLGPDTSRSPPPRNSTIKSITSTRSGSLSVDLAAEFGIGNPYHTPSASLSSAISLSGQDSNSRLSRTLSKRLSPNDQGPPGNSGIDDLMIDLQASMRGRQPPTPVQLDRNPSINSSRRGQSRDGRNPSRSRSASRPRQQGPTSYETPAFNLKFEVDRYQASARDRSEPRYDQDASMSYSQTPARDYPNPKGTNYKPSMPSQGFPHASGPQMIRGPCKACSKEIRGKSISSADGRLTGKYHKACFVCTMCREPFSSAEFYVLKDRPFCELHYHELNGSLCGSCGKGIEGQYLEDEALSKYHLGCFRCTDCGVSLSDGYFEVEGGFYCERDAWKRVQFDPPTSDGYSMPLDVALTSPTSDYSPALASLISPTTPGNSLQANLSPLSPILSRGPPTPLGLPPRPGDKGPAAPRRPIGLPRGQRLPPGMGPVPRPRMNKRMTRLGIM